MILLFSVGSSSDTASRPQERYYYNIYYYVNAPWRSARGKSNENSYIIYYFILFYFHYYNIYFNIIFFRVKTYIS